MWKKIYWLAVLSVGRFWWWINHVHDFHIIYSMSTEYMHMFLFCFVLFCFVVVMLSIISSGHVSYMYTVYLYIYKKSIYIYIKRVYLRIYVHSFALLYFVVISLVCRGPFYWCGLTWIPAWISNYIHYKVWDEITYPFPNFNSCTVEVWEWISNFIPCFPGHVITYPCWD